MCDRHSAKEDVEFLRKKSDCVTTVFFIFLIESTKRLKQKIITYHILAGQSTTAGFMLAGEMGGGVLFFTVAPGMSKLN